MGFIWFVIAVFGSWLSNRGKRLNCTCESARYTCTGPGYCLGFACYISRSNLVEKVERYCFSESEVRVHCSFDHSDFYCCRDHSFCNDLDVLNPTAATTDQGSENGSGWEFIVAIVAGVIGVIILSWLISSYVFKRIRKANNISGNDGSSHRCQSNSEDHGEPGREQGTAMSFEGDELQSLSGKGEAMLMQQTIARQLTWVKVIGYGRFGQVWHCTFHNMDVAVKCCTTKDENSWTRESVIYQTTMLRHDNVLGFRAADIYDSEGTTKMLLITDYHPRGSLYSVLQDNVLSVQKVLTLASSAACGLNHLHSLIHGTNTKPAIAHRDLKSKNVLVKENGEACLCDLGLSVVYNPQDKFEVNNTRVGTKRYMAPEVLSGEISPVLFDGFKLADIYAFGLLLWEMLSRCQLYDGEDVVEYHEPYYNMVPADPTFEQMMHVVGTRGARPRIQNNWHKHPVMRDVVSMMTSCWKRLPQSRLSALRLWKNLSALCERCATSATSASTTSTMVSHVGISTMTIDTAMMSIGSGEESVVSMETSL